MPPAGLSRKWSGASLVLAALLIAGWAVLYATCARQPLCDEPSHLEAIWHFLEGRPGWPEGLSMLPGYHYAVIAFSGGHPSLRSARLISGLFGLAGLAAFALTWRRLHERPAGPAALAWASLPVLQPFFGLAYTDAAGVALLLWATWAQVSRRRVLAALFFAIACVFRQTTLIWIGFFVSLDASRDLLHGEGVSWPRRLATSLLGNIGLLAVLGLAGVAIFSAGRLTMNHDSGNSLQPNPATPHFTALLLALLALPWLWSAWSTIPPRNSAAMNPPRTRRNLGWAAAAAVLVAVLCALTYRNAHPWNHDLWWPGLSFTLLRNWPLVALQNFPALRLISGLLVAAMAVAGALLIARQPQRRALVAVACFGALLLATNSLVEPRYFITPLTLALLFLDFDDRTWLKLAGWFLVIDLAQAPFILTARSLW